MTYIKSHHSFGIYQEMNQFIIVSPTGNIGNRRYDTVGDAEAAIDWAVRPR